jgi:thiol-disulfide isomerase/thioredoxin
MRKMALAAAAIWLATIGASAAEPQPYDLKAFAAAQAANKPIVVDISATWCPICARQKPILSALEKSPEFQDLVVFDVDFDSQKDIVRAFHAEAQSTLVVFKGKVEAGRSTGVTDPAAIRDLLLKSKGD